MKKMILIILVLLGVQIQAETIVQKKIEMDENQFSYIDVDKEWNTEGTLAFSSDLECHIASSGRQICDNPDSYELDLVNLKDIIFKDVDEIRSHKGSLSETRLAKYLSIYKNYGFKDTSYEALFSYLFLINNKYSKTCIAEPLKFNGILSIRDLDLNNTSNAEKYNNMAYYLQKAGANNEAVFLLEKILKKYPNRTVAYYNLGDAYWELDKKEKAIASYKTYIEQIKAKGKEKQIPKIVKDRVKGAQ